MGAGRLEVDTQGPETLQKILLIAIRGFAFLILFCVFFVGLKVFAIGLDQERGCNGRVCPPAGLIRPASLNHSRGRDRTSAGGSWTWCWARSDGAVQRVTPQASAANTMRTSVRRWKRLRQESRLKTRN